MRNRTKLYHKCTQVSENTTTEPATKQFRPCRHCEHDKNVTYLSQFIWSLDCDNDKHRVTETDKNVTAIVGRRHTRNRGMQLERRQCSKAARSTHGSITFRYFLGNHVLQKRMGSHFEATEAFIIVAVK